MTEPSPPSGDTGEPRWQVRATALVALASALVAAALPLASWVRETFAKRRELEVSRAQQEFTVRTAYLDRAIDPARPAALRETVLRFLAQTADDPRMKRWAEEELRIVATEVEQLEGQIAKLREALAEAEQRTAAAAAELEQQRLARSGDARAIDAAESRLRASLAMSELLEQRVLRADARLTGVAPGNEPVPPAGAREGLSGPAAETRLRRPGR